MAASNNAIASYRKTYPQATKSVGEARRAVVEFAKTCGFFGQSLDDIEVAVGEALANAVEHGCRHPGDVEVSVWRDARAFVVEVKDNGTGFDHGTVADRQPTSEAARGFGTFIMRELMDAVEYSESGTRLRLVKHLIAHEAEVSRVLEA